MGWWKPYFFIDLTGVQVLIPAAQIEGPVSFLLISTSIVCLCFLDRFLSHYVTPSIYKQTAVYTLQRFTGGLVMLIMMSFNVILFVEMVVFLGMGELYMKYRDAESSTYAGIADDHSLELPDRTDSVLQ